MSCANYSPILFNRPGVPPEVECPQLGNAHLSLFLTDRFCSTPSIKFRKHWPRTSCLGRGWLFMRLALRSLKYCWETGQCQTQASTPNLTGGKWQEARSLGVYLGSPGAQGSASRSIQPQRCTVYPGARANPTPLLIILLYGHCLACWSPCLHCGARTHDLLGSQLYLSGEG